MARCNLPETKAVSDASQRLQSENQISEPEPVRDGAQITTFGCRLNTYESELMRQHAAAAGLHDAVIINTCAVTAEAVRQAGQAVRRARRDNPDAKIIVTGCAAQIDPQRFAGIDGVDHVIGNAEKRQPATFSAIAAGDLASIKVDDIMRLRETAGHMVEGFGARARAYVEIQNGCDHRCTFCIIPFGRGPSRSVPAGKVVGEVAKLVEQGYREVVLTGVDITSYGTDLPGNASLGRLVKQVLKHVPELARLRLSSIDQVEVDRELLDAIADQPRLMPHLHLSMQAGHDLTLKRMKRRHLRADAIEFCQTARRLRPDVTFGADLIVGFPTETEEMFQATLDIVDECALTYLHVFPFSPRAGTPAARMPQVERAQIKQRAARLREKGDAQFRCFLDRQIGTSVDVLLERPDIGRTPQFAEVEIPSASQIGEIRSVAVISHDGRRLHAETLA